MHPLQHPQDLNPREPMITSPPLLMGNYTPHYKPTLTIMINRLKSRGPQWMTWSVRYNSLFLVDINNCPL